MGACLGLEYVVVVFVVVWAVVGRLAALTTFSADSYVLLICPGCENFLSFVLGYVRMFEEALKSGV